MTAKRFTMIYFETDGNLIFDETKHDSEWYDSTECLQDNEILKLLNELSDENGQLKKELKRCKDWLNSDKYDYQLTLAFIKNKGYSLKDVLEYEKELIE